MTDAADALARALPMPSDPDTPGWMEEFNWHRMEQDPDLAARAAPFIEKRLAAEGYAVVPIDLATRYGDALVRRLEDIEQAAEAADREAAGESGETAPGLAAAVVATSAAADLLTPSTAVVGGLDVEALAAPILEWVEDTMQPQFTKGGDYQKWREDGRRVIAAAYAAARWWQR